jgi:hypothetical protein
MTRLRWPSPKGVEYESVRRVESAAASGVAYLVARMSFSRRLDLMRQVRDLARKVEYLEAGDESGDRMEGGLLRAEIDKLYVQWGLRGVEGLEIDGVEATPEMLAECGPEDLFREALNAVRRETGLNDEERKN